MAKFCEVLPKYQQLRIINRINQGELPDKVFADYIEFVNKMPLSLCFTGMRSEYERENKSMVQFASDFMNQVDEEVHFATINEKEY